VTAATVGRAVPRAPGRRTPRSWRLIGLLLLVGLLVAACLASIAVGTRSIGLGEVWRAPSEGDLGSEEAVIVRQLRVPRTVLGLLVGLALGASGARRLRPAG
jgi:ABC-type Fe3+-siderophore transport system permease subunit